MQPKSVTRGCLRESLDFREDGGSHHRSDLAQPPVDCGTSQHSHPVKPVPKHWQKEKQHSPPNTHSTGILCCLRSLYFQRKLK